MYFLLRDKIKSFKSVIVSRLILLKWRDDNMNDESCVREDAKTDP